MVFQAIICFQGKKNPSQSVMKFLYLIKSELYLYERGVSLTHKHINKYIVKMGHLKLEAKPA